MSDAIAVNMLGGAIRAVAASLHIYRMMLKLNDLAPLQLVEMGLGGVIERDDVGLSSLVQQGLDRSVLDLTASGFLISKSLQMTLP